MCTTDVLMVLEGKESQEYEYKWYRVAQFAQPKKVSKPLAPASTILKIEIRESDKSGMHESSEHLSTYGIFPSCRNACALCVSCICSVLRMCMNTTLCKLYSLFLFVGWG